MEPKHFESLYPPEVRFEEIQKMLTYIKSGNSVQLVSLPGVGRSNLMGLLAYSKAARTLHLKEMEDKYHFVMVNLSEVKKRPSKEVFKLLFLDLITSLTERGFKKQSDKVNNLFDKAIETNDELVIMQALRHAIRYLCLENGLTVVFMLDKTGDYVPSLDSTFFGNLRVLRDEAKYKFSVVMSLNKPLEELLEPEIISDFYEFIADNIVYIPISDPTLIDFRLGFIEKSLSKKVDSSVKDEILRLTGGHGKLARLCLEAYLSGNHEGNLGNFLLGKNRVKGVLSEIWTALTPYEQDLIKNGRAQESSNLISLGLLKNNQLAIPMLEFYAKSLGAGEANAKLRLNKETGEILRGNQVISDQLTSLEYKLLKHLIESGGIILERDDLISATWGDIGSTSGVTEQALDQLVFRLRKKIEENPDDPKQIITIRGRGIKFTG